MTVAKRFSGKVVLVTGASRGIGAEIATRFASEGATVVAAARTMSAGQNKLDGSLEETVALAAEHGGEMVARSVDLGSAADRERLVADVSEEFGHIDILVNNAAVTWFDPVERFAMRHLEVMFEVQVTAPFHLAQLAIPSMRAFGGHIVNISSRAARHPTLPYTDWDRNGQTVYGMCKAALERFTTGLAAELRPEGIAVNALAPKAVVPTPGTIHYRLTSAEDPDAEAPWMLAAATLELCGRSPQEITGRIAYSQDLLAELGDA